ncbi:MAG: rRNA maturation RNase YbeY [Candidatus Omnitrophica bacterium]|nr:rRNA maturation RNase YbeY [Candidatus Omnitrophota bacterium]
MNTTTDRSRKKISLIDRQRKIKVNSEYLDSGIDFLEKKIPTSIKKMNVVLVEDKEIIRLNKQFLQKNVSTDVLTFRIGSIVEIVISVETAKRQATDQHHRIEEEILYLIIHGLLHVSGYNDNSQNNYDKMKTEQDKLFFEVLRNINAERKKSGYC